MPADRGTVDAARVAAEVLTARRYRSLAPAFVERIARRESKHARRHADAVKETKRALHAAFGAYVQEFDPAPAIAEIEAAAAAGDDALRAASLRLMERHASTRERVPVIDRFYLEIFEVTGQPHHVVDLACGFGPLALPWTSLGAGDRYDAYDVDRRFIALAEACREASGVGGVAEARDVAGDPPAVEADVALLLKAVPCFEQQLAGSALRVIEAVRARHVVVSFPTRSLGGAGKGMIPHYRDLMARIVSEKPWTRQELLFPLELVFVLDKGLPTRDSDE